MQPKFVAKPAFTVVGLHIHVKAKSPEISTLWEKFGPRMREVKHLAEPGVCYGLMDHFDRSIGELDYTACVPVLQPVSQVSDVPAEMTSLEVPANTYAVFETTLQEIPKTFDEIYGTWLPASGYQVVDAPYFEYYPATFNPDDPAPEMSIYIPVKKP